MKITDLKNIDLKKALLVVFVAVLFGYVVWDISLRIRDNFFVQGYQTAVSQVFEQGQNEDCLPFNLFSEDDEMVLINVECLQQAGADLEDQLIVDEE